jgi:hypothetical protein
MLRRSRVDQENHEAGIPAASIPSQARRAHTASRTAKNLNQERHHEVGNPGSFRNPFWLRNHDVRGQPVNSFLLRAASSINPSNDAPRQEFGTGRCGGLLRQGARSFM